VIKYRQFISCRTALQLRVVALIFSGVAACSQFAVAQDPANGGQQFGFSEVPCQTPPTSWWSARLGSNGLKYTSKYYVSNKARLHREPLPICPPLYGPTYGYYQTCWRQLPVDRRCVSSETIPAEDPVARPTPAAAIRSSVDVPQPDSPSIELQTPVSADDEAPAPTPKVNQ
jgi:hypothetical protein